MDELLEEGKDSIDVGKIYDIFAGKGITQTHKMKNNEDGMNITIDLMDKDFEGMCFTNLVDFDMKFGHRNDIDGYANATTEFDLQLGQMMDKMRDDDLLILTADHGCDPSTPSTDHSREHVPMLAYGKMIKEGIDLGTRTSFSDIAKTISEAFSTKGEIEGNSFYKNIVK